MFPKVTCFDPLLSPPDPPILLPLLILRLITALLHSSFVCFRYMNKKHLIDVTEVFRYVDVEKKYRFAKLAVYSFLFILIIIRLVVSDFLLIP